MLLVVAGAVLALVHAVHAEPKPSFVVMLADDMGWGDWSRTGSPGRTPHLEEMSRSQHAVW
jgi:hypothetical protein